MNLSVKIILLQWIVLIVCLISGGCSGGNTANVGNIYGPGAIYETTHGYYIITFTGTNPKIQWSCYPPHAGLFDDPTSIRTKFIAGKATLPNVIEIRVLIETDQWGPVMLKKNIQIRTISGFYVSEIEGPAITDENSTVTYAVYAGGDTGITYDWSVNPPYAGLFDSPGSDSTDFKAAEVAQDTNVEIRVRVNSDNYEPVIRVLALTVKNIEALYVGEISGPSEVYEKLSAVYNIEAYGDAGITCHWACEPPDAGFFEAPETLSTKFTAEEISDDIQAEILVTINSDHFGPEIRTLNITIMDLVEKGWARTWGGYWVDQAFDVAVDNMANVYVSGRFYDVVDFDPGQGEDIHQTEGMYDVFLSKFNPNGGFIWTRCWGGKSYGDQGCGVAIDSTGNVYVTGPFSETVDFDPGPGIDEHTSYAHNDIFMSKFTPDGEFLWARTWGGPLYDWAWDIAIDGADNIFVVGVFTGWVDFDPGPGTDLQESISRCDAFLSKFNTNGDHQWTRHWGDEDDEEDQAIGLTTDKNNNVYVTGHFSSIVDFDPGPEIDLHTPSPGVDAFDVYLSKFNSNGDFLWVRTWGGSKYEYGFDVITGDDGNVFVVGSFCSPVIDLDPGPETDEHVSNGGTDVFLTKLNPDGDFIWARTWGGIYGDNAKGVLVNNTGNIIVTGGFKEIVDFDTGPGIEEIISNGDFDAFLCEFDTNGVFRWVRTWGGDSTDYCRETTSDVFGNLYAVGGFSSVADFDPGNEIDEHISYDEQDAFLCKFLPDGTW